MFLFCVVLASTGIGPATGRYYVKGVRPNVKKSLENLLEKFSESKGPDLMAVYTRTYDLFIWAVSSSGYIALSGRMWKQVVVA
jgi:hypothetical protein